MGGEDRDTFTSTGDDPVMKPLNVLMHERMAQRPFIPFADFDTDAFVDYGRKHYDNNRSFDKRAKRFRTLEKLMRKRSIIEAKERKKAQRAQRLASAG